MRMPKALLLGSVLLLGAPSGCTTAGGVALRPDGTPGPQECPAKALEVMRYLRLRVGDAALADLDANQIDARRISLYDGPIESILKDDMGTLEATTRLYGQVWTSGPQVVIRWYEAHPPDGDKVPICAVARLSRDQMRKLPESKPGMAILDGSVAAAYIVDSFR
ncbi:MULTISPECIES: serine/threonine protein kinase [Corallococcus]|uniref:Serine/threonine protein kinase n=1 Tax=Corallococcus exiguus TaxID=83462 RepID=A0A7X5BVA2_9BACT|nr:MULTISPECIES: serine/threonine protein kinase [Corallococcus]NBC45225.1 serine/threonine protein kinase [Corallococcus exiguus]NPD26038.1 serine/threonine protein kinase [Corallococcus exiguus]RKG57473.1 serine/threonine protein kinase [Corallococcus sp. AB011P]TNV64459.1 serine/threonine protein kinase [Corallococcus exiguus]